MAGTLVRVPDGWLAIERLRVGDRVLATGSPRGATAYQPVTAILDLPPQEMTLVRFHQDGAGEDDMRIDTLATTAAQRFHVDAGSSPTGAGGWRAAGDQLDCGDRLLVAQGTDARVVCADVLFETDRPGVAWSPGAWGVEQNDGSGYLADLRFRPPSVSDQESFNWGPDGGLITRKFQAPAIGIVVEEFHSLFVGTLGAWAHDATGSGPAGRTGRRSAP
jgi:hypothetical protein